MRDKEVRDLYTAAMLGWRRRFRERLDLIAARYPPRIAVDLDHLADMLSAIAEGGIIVSKVIRDKRALSQQLILYRDFIRAVFLGTRGLPLAWWPASQPLPELHVSLQSPSAARLLARWRDERWTHYPKRWAQCV
jgi:hypothetical protein